MQLEGLKQAPFNTTFMGAMRGALDYYGIAATDASLYGASGHAFVMNIHEQLCPSGPYCFETDPILERLANVGLRITFHGFFLAGSERAERAAVEATLRAALERGAPCFLANMEYQLITGFDDTGFLTAQPWPCNKVFPPAHLTFGTWAELGDEIHMPLYVIDRTDPIDPTAAATSGLKLAVALWRTPGAYTSQAYGMGAPAYANWSGAVRNGHGASHGNWWNGTVWAECRAMASAYVREVADLLPSRDEALALSGEYGAIAGLLERCSVKELPDADKLAMLAEAAEREEACIARIEGLLARTG